MPMIGLIPAAVALRVEVVGAEHVAVVGHRDRGHAELGGAREQVVEPGRAVEHGVLGVHVEVDEVPTRWQSRTTWAGRSSSAAASGRTSQEVGQARRTAWTDQLGEERQPTRPRPGSS